MKKSSSYMERVGIPTTLKLRRVGIWGFGVVGKSVYRHLLKTTKHIEILDAKPLSESDQAWLASNNTPFCLQSDLRAFLERNDRIVPSPGIDLRPYTAYAHKWLSELDLFAATYKKPIIAITGSIGKTSTTHLLGQLLNAAGKKIAVGGNIGTGMLDLVEQKSDGVLLEVSSFQLEQCSTFAPDLAIWTNFHPNHLDRHGSQAQYFEAKSNIMRFQREGQQALLPLGLASNTAGDISLFSTTTPKQEQLSTLPTNTKLFYTNLDAIYLTHNGITTTLINRNQLPDISYPDNWLIICAALHLLNIPLTVIHNYGAHLTLPEHRLEKVATLHDVDFYNDSKSTTPEATLAAVQRLQGKPIHLLLGGIGKGIDREPLIQKLAGRVKSIYCFGKEAEKLQELCKKYGIEHAAFATLDEAVAACAQKTRPHEIVLLSPAGASFDLFEHFAHRGEHFKMLVRQVAK